MFSGFLLRRGLSFEEFVAQSGFDAWLVTEWQQLKRPPAEQQLRDLAVTFGVSIAELTAPRPGEPIERSTRYDLPVQAQLTAWTAAAQETWGPVPQCPLGLSPAATAAGIATALVSSVRRAGMVCPQCDREAASAGAGVCRHQQQSPTDVHS